MERGVESWLGWTLLSVGSGLTSVSDSVSSDSEYESYESESVYCVETWVGACAGPAGLYSLFNGEDGRLFACGLTRVSPSLDCGREQEFGGLMSCDVEVRLFIGDFALEPSESLSYT